MQGDTLGPHPRPGLGRLCPSRHPPAARTCHTAAEEWCLLIAFVYFGSLSCMNEFAELSFPVKLSLIQNTAITQVM